MSRSYLIGEKHLIAGGGLLRTIRLQDEYYVSTGAPEALISAIRSSSVPADVFTFVQELDEPQPKYDYLMEWDSRAVVPITTYDHWFKNQITFKPRNKLKKSQKSGVEVRVMQFNDELIRAIGKVYDESPIRQGKRNLHYGKNFETLKSEHQTFLDRSDFIGAFYQGEMIGFAKVTHSPKASILMNIVAMISHRDKAPTNALVAKAIEICAQKRIPRLNYSIWGRQGLNEFKAANGFERIDVPRYFVPLNWRGRLGLALKLHRSISSYVPERFLDKAVRLRTKWNEYKYRKLREPATSDFSETTRSSAGVR